MENWDEIRIWRRSTRAELLSRRTRIPRDERARIRAVLRDLLWEQFPELRQGCIGFYWPFKGEIDLRHLVRDCLALGAEAALPVIVGKRQPLEFWAWRPHMQLKRGFWNIPVPTERKSVRPTALLVPLLGFDASGHRLGYGGGYYDRTLATMAPKPFTIGIGYEFGRLGTIYPQTHDIPLDTIATETGRTRFRCRGEPPGRAAPDPRMDQKLDEALKGTFPASDPFDLSDEGGSIYASPPCFMHELDPEYLGYLSTSETIALLNQVLKVGGAGYLAVADMGRKAKGEAGLRAMLTRHITRLGGTARPQAGESQEILVDPHTSRERIDLLNGDQAWAVRKLQEVLPRIGDSALHRDLKAMLDVLERDIRRTRG